MSRLEDLIHETLVAQETEAPPGATLLDDVQARRRQRRRASTLVTAGLAGAAAAAVLAILTQVPLGNSHPPAHPSTVAQASTPQVRIFALPSDGWKPGDPALDALATGPFHAARLPDGQVCAWLGTRFRPTLWPRGYHVRLHPVQLLGPRGQVIAHAGDVLSTGGGGRPAPAGTPCAAAGQWTWSVMSVPREATKAPPAGATGILVGRLYLPGGIAR